MWLLIYTILLSLFISRCTVKDLLNIICIRCNLFTAELYIWSNYWQTIGFLRYDIQHFCCMYEYFKNTVLYVIFHVVTYRRGRNLA